MRRLAESTLTSWLQKPKRLPLVIRGVRQVGKTFLVREFGRNNLPGFHEFNFETDPHLKQIFTLDPNPARIIEQLAFAANKTIGERDLLFFDEIQECPEALTALKYFAEDMPHRPIIVAGSLLGVALNERSYPVGKVEYLSLGPLSFEEFLLGIGDDRGVEALKNFYLTRTIQPLQHEHLLEKLKRFYVTGGLPRPIMEYANLQAHPVEAFRAVRETQRNLIRDYVSDFSKHSAATNAVHIRAIFENVPLQLASVQELSTKKFRFNDSIPNRNGYAQLQAPIDWLDHAGLVHRIKIANRAEFPLAVYCKENFFKLFAFDVGILGTQLNLAPEILLKDNYGIAKGYFAENLVLQALVENEFENPICWVQNDAEIEFLIQREGEIIPIEVKSGIRSKAKSLASYIRRYEPKLALKLTGGVPNYDLKNRIYSLPLYAAWGVRGMQF